MENHDHHGVEELSGHRMTAVTGLNLIITAAEIVGGVLSGSLALLSDALHNLNVHTWRSDQKTVYLEAHVEVRDMQVSETMVIYNKIIRELKKRFAIGHATIQFETDYCDDKEIVRLEQDKAKE